jgi:hypothetical protein
MAYPPPILRKERKILEIIERGHPERRMTVHTRHGSGQVDALEWSEIQVASGMPFNEFCDCIAHLVANDMIKSATKHPGFIASIFGKEKQDFFWTTDRGSVFLRGNPEDTVPDKIERPDSADLTEDDIEDAVRIYEDSLSSRPYVEIEEIGWASTVLDEDIKSEVQRASIELEEMWKIFEAMFGHRGAVRNEREKGIRDPVVRRSVVRVYRAKDEQLRRKNFPASQKPQAWFSHYAGGDVGLEPPPWGHPIAPGPE